MNKSGDQNETLGYLIMKWFQQHFHCDRLRDRFLYYTGLSFFINLYVFIMAYRNNAILLSPALFLWIFMVGISVYFVRKNISTRIVGNRFKESQAGVKKRILIISFSLFILYFLRRIKIPATLFYPFLAIPISLSFLGATIVTLIWIIHYESNNGAVFIVRNN